MRTVIVCLLLSGCSVIDGVSGTATNTRGYQRIFLGSESITVKRRAHLDRYTCGQEQLVCDYFGATWTCSCETFSLARARR